jgi:hypothetical protein
VLALDRPAGKSGDLALDSPSATQLAHSLIPASALEQTPWLLKVKRASSGRDYAEAPSSSLKQEESGIPAHDLAKSRVVTRQWVRPPGSWTSPLPDAVLSVIDSVAVFPTSADAHRWIAGVENQARSLGADGAHYFVTTGGGGRYAIALEAVKGASQVTPAEEAELNALISVANRGLPFG